jgi:hypothetical protein
MIAIAGVDSSLDAPSAADADAARYAGIGVWGGYLATRADVGLLAPWPRGAFENARRCGGTPIGFCSGWDDPRAIRELAAAWNVRPCLDDEPGIRADGFDRQAWVTAAGAGLYGLLRVHVGVTAAFHIAALYPGFLPGATWPVRVRPDSPCGWQWQGTHPGPGGRSVDSLVLDPWFGAPPAPAPAPPPKEEAVTGPIAVAVFDGMLHTFQVFQGSLRHRWQGPDGWEDEVLPGASGLEFEAPVYASTTDVPGQIQLWIPRADGGAHHAWYDGTWQSEVLA